MVAEEKFREDNITCPACGWEHQDSWEFNQEDHFDYECPECDVEFEVQVEVEVSYTTRPKDCADEHSFDGEQKRYLHDKDYYAHTKEVRPTFYDRIYKDVELPGVGHPPEVVAVHTRCSKCTVVDIKNIPLKEFNDVEALVEMKEWNDRIKKLHS